jgi:hypothetical protein
MPRRATTACKVCGTPHRPDNRFCSKKCWLSVARTMLVCECCKQAFSAPSSGVRRGQYKCCSLKCRSTLVRKYPVVEFNGMTFLFHSPSGYYVSKLGVRLNRAVWEYHNGPIPDGYVIHHKDQNKVNNSIDNLELMEWGEHSAHHHEIADAAKYVTVTCVGCDQPLRRLAIAVRNGTKQYCSRACANARRERRPDGTYA